METRLYVLGLGFLESDQSIMLANSERATVHNKNRPAVWGRVPILSFLVRHPKVTVLFDTGCDPQGMSGNWPEALRDSCPFYITEDERIENRLSQLGLGTDDIDVVVASHLHFDHVGNLRLFKKAKILVHPAELSHALMSTRVSSLNKFAYQNHDFDVEGLQWELVDNDLEIAPGLEVIALEGHAPGILGLVVHLKDSGTFICPGDALYSAINYGPPPRLPGQFYDSLGFHRTVAKVRRLQLKYDARILYPHDLKQFEEEVLKSPQFYS
jgi:N-acyl homoserine lactone hydrolase